MNKRICQLAVILAVASLAGCGLKGPLYFPADEQAKPQTTKTTPATQSGNQAQQSATTRGQSVQPAQ
ncbi:LPS translocon maturation chaperone LptM [Pseudomonas cerasi]